VLSHSRRWIFFLTFVFAAFVTPTQDPFTMLLMAGPMIVLFEGAIQFARVVDKRRARRDAALALPGVGEDEPSQIDVSPSTLETSPTPLDSSTGGRPRMDGS
jgi:sec-independent protein translocase protein TatC